MDGAAFDEGRVVVNAEDVPLTARGDPMDLRAGSHAVKFKPLTCYDHFTPDEASEPRRRSPPRPRGSSPGGAGYTATRSSRASRVTGTSTRRASRWRTSWAV